MTFPLVRIVEAPDPTAATRYDFNRDEEGAATRRVMAEGFTLGVPSIQGDPDAIGVTYGRRQPYFVQRVKGSKAQALAALSSLSRELLRPTNWLLVQLNATTAPVWLRIYRSEFGALSLREVYVKTKTGDPVLVPDTWEIPVPLVAEAFGYQERVTHDPVTVTQTPDGTNPMRIVLPAIKGDAPTGLRVEIAPEVTADASSVGGAWIVACLNGSTDMEDPVIEIGTSDGLSAETGTAAPTSEAGHFGGSRRVVTIASATPNLIERLAGQFPVVPIGRYKVLLRCQVAATGGDQTFLFRFVEKTTPVYRGPATSIDFNALDTDRKLWVDLGDINVPTRVRPPVDAVGNPHAVSFGLEIGTADGSAASISIDAFKLIPIDGPHVDSATVLRFESGYVPLRGGHVGTLDGEIEEYWSYSSLDDDVFNGGQPVMLGGFPVADPVAESHTLIVMAIDGGPYDGAASAPWITDLGTEAVVTVSYHPRVLHLGDGA